MTVVALEVLFPLGLSLYAIASFARRGQSAGSHLARLLSRVPGLLLAVFLFAVVLWLMTPSRSPLTLLEMQLLWLAPALFWSGLALAVCRKGRRGGHEPRRAIVAVPIFLLLFGLGTLLSWLTTVGVVQLTLLSPRPVDWGAIHVIPVGEWLELFWPALTTFHGRVDGWAWNRLILIILGLLLWRRAYLRAGRAHACAGDESTRLTAAGQRMVLPALVLGFTLPAVAATWSSDCLDWRLGWCEGRLDVPADPGNPDLGTISVSYLVHPARGAQQPDGTLVAASGGPAAASTDRALFLSALGEMADNYDLLISDYRGFGRSSYVGCPGLDIGVAEENVVTDCLMRLGPLAPLMSGRHAAHDLEAIRKELGLGPVSIYGFSYGTYFAQEYAMTYPSSVRAMVLDSTLPVHSGEWVFMTPELMPGAADDGSVTGQAAQWSGLVAEVRAGKGTEPSVQDLAILHLYGTWPGIPEGRQRALELSGEERLAALAELSSQLQEQLSAMRDDPIMSLVGPQAAAIYGCNDYVMPFPKSAGAAEREQAVRDHARANFAVNIAPFTWDEINEATAAANGLRVDGFLHQQCLYWDYPKDSDTPDPEIPDVPVLLLSGLLDDATTPAMSQEMEKRWNASMVSVMDGDHFVLSDLERSCARDAAFRFLADPEHHAPLRCAPGE